MITAAVARAGLVLSGALVALLFLHLYRDRRNRLLAGHRERPEEDTSPPEGGMNLRRGRALTLALAGAGLVASLILLPASDRALPDPAARPAVVLVLDLSPSMAVGPEGRRRWDRALGIARRIVTREPPGPTALVVFSATARTLAPPTRDRDTLLAYLNRLAPGTIRPHGSHIGPALEEALANLSREGDGSGEGELSRGRIVIVSDGEVWDGDRGLSSSIRRRIRDGEIAISAVAVSEPREGPVPPNLFSPSRREDPSRRPLSRARPERLRGVVEELGGRVVEGAAVERLLRRPPSPTSRSGRTGSAWVEGGVLGHFPALLAVVWLALIFEARLGALEARHEIEEEA